MLFTSIQFLIFLAVSACVYFVIPKRWQWPFLLCISLWFYTSIARKLVVFLVFSGLSTWALACLLEKWKAKEKTALAAAKAAGAAREARTALKKRYLPVRRLLLAAFLLCNVGLLLVFKFYGMFAQLLAQYGAALPALRLAMPLGISFYTLMLVTYFLDVYNGHLTAEPNPAKVVLFTSFFPQVMQGPISRWSDSAPSLFAPHAFSYEALVLGCERMLWGYCKKLILADRLNVVTTTLYSGYAQYQGFYVVAAGFAYTIQLYCDFSGGIDVALGAAQIFGITLPENFVRPLFSKNIAEFWRRWHITLGNFLRDYLFYPLTFSRPIAKLGRAFKQKGWRWAAKWIPTYIAMLIVWFISGVWHGEGLQYICNGLWHGFLITLGETLAEPSARMWKKLGVRQDNRLLNALRVMRTFCLIAIGELMFRSSDMAMMTGMFRGLFAVWNPRILWDGSLLSLGLDAQDTAVACIAVFVLLGVSLAARRGSLRVWLNRQALPLRWGILLAGVVCVAVFGVYGPAYAPTPFIYFQF